MALALLRAMQDSQLDGDTVAYNAAISAWGTHTQHLEIQKRNWCVLTPWRIIPVSKWLITMVSKSPKWGYSPYKWHFHGL